MINSRGFQLLKVVSNTPSKECYCRHVIFEFSIVLNIKIAVFWDVMSFNLIDRHSTEVSKQSVAWRD
jgi:hypothetical protein